MKAPPRLPPRLDVPLPSARAGLVAAAALLQLGLVAARGAPMARFETDSVGYLRHAAALLGPPDAFHGPGYPLAIAAVTALGPEPFLAGLLVSALAIVALVAVSTQLSPRPAEGLLTGALVALSPASLAAGEMVLSDALGAALAWGAILCLLRGRPTLTRLLLGGGLVGAAILVRPVYLGLLALPLLGTGPRLRALGIAGPAALLVLAPFLALSAWHTGDPLWNHNHLNVAFHLQGTPRDWSRFPRLAQYPSWAAVLAEDPARFATTWARSFLAWPFRAVDPVLAGVGWLLPVGILSWIQLREHAVARLGLALLLYILPASLVWMEPRFALPAAPLLALGAARGIGVASAWAGALAPAVGPVLRRSLVLACGLLLAARGVRSLDHLRQDEAPEYMELSRQLARALPPNSRVLAPKPQAAHFAGMVPLPFSALPLQGRSPDELLPLLRAAEVQVLVFDARYGAEAWPDLAPLLSGPPPEGLEQIAHVAAPQRILAFRVR